MYLKTSGIILHSYKYSDSSLILKAYTQSAGLGTFMIKGLSKKNKQKGLINNFGVLELIHTENNNKNIGFIKELNLIKNFHSINNEIIKSSIVLFLKEFILKSVKEEEKNQQLFSFLISQFTSLNELNTSDTVNFHIRFILELTSLIGIYPNFNYSEHNKFFNLSESCFTSRVSSNHPVSSDISRILFSLASNEQKSDSINITREERNQILKLLINYYKQHIEGFNHPKSLDVLNVLFN